MVIEMNPVAYYAHRMLQGFEAMTMGTLLFQRPDQALGHAVLLRAVRRDELVSQTVASAQPRVMATRED